MLSSPVITLLSRYAQQFHPVIPFLPGTDRLLKMDFTASNQQLMTEVVNDTAAFTGYINNTLHSGNYRYGVGGYGENRTVYSRSRLFDDKNEPRTLHLGTDIWGEAGTPVFAFMGGMIYGLAYNDNFGDYGATMILLHQLEGIPFYTLYGHLSLNDIKNKVEGQYVVRGQTIAHFGAPPENGHWPPHLHFQIILEMGIKKGDYPGVCKYSEREKFLRNCPDPDLILQLNQYCLLPQ